MPLIKASPSLGPNSIGCNPARASASAPGSTVYEELGLTVQHVMDEALKLVPRGKQ